MSRTAIIAFNAAWNLAGNEILYVINPPPTLRESETDIVESAARRGWRDRADYIGREKPSGHHVTPMGASRAKDAVDVFISLLRTKRNSLSIEGLF